MAADVAGRHIRPRRVQYSIPGALAFDDAHVTLQLYMWALLLLSLYQTAGNAQVEPSSPSAPPAEGIVPALRALVRSWFAERDFVKANGHAHTYAPVDGGERGAAAVAEDDEDPDEYWKER